MSRSLLEAAREGRKQLLEAARDRIAEEIDGGVPPHALRNLIAELSRIDTELRREGDGDTDPDIPGDGPFNAKDI